MIASDFQQFEGRQQQVELSGETSFIQGHAFAIETLLQNLLANASKYSPDGGQILVDVHPVASGTRLIIEDSGPGIPPDQYARVFDRFYRYQNLQQLAEAPGCGLGLAIVKHIVDLHHADIKLAKSPKTTGLQVTVNFPAVLSE